MNHSSVQDVLLEMGNRSLCTIARDVLTLTGVMSRHVSTGGFASGGG
jgi:hypothetical protein